MAPAYFESLPRLRRPLPGIMSAVASPVDRDPEARRLVGEFHRLYYQAGVEGGTWEDTRWLGVQAKKCPLDLWVYQEILVETRPDVVVECGTAFGGSALFIASVLDLLGKGRVITVDIVELAGRPAHPRITYVAGSSTDPDTFQRVKGLILPGESVMVVLDSDHARHHVARELELYSTLVTPGQYLIVEDTNIGGTPVLPDWGPGPREAVEAFLAATDRFEVDRSREKHGLTFNPGGYLRRVRP